MEELNYQEVIERLKMRFPDGTVKKRADNERAYIPNQVYTDRVERETGSQWSREIRAVEINVPHGYVKVIARVIIGAHFRDGIGFAEFAAEPAVGKVKLSNKVDQATNEAIREALDTWQMGWRDLAQHNMSDWGGNPALKHLLISDPSEHSNASVHIHTNVKVDRFCIFTKCGVELTNKEWSLLGEVPGLNREKMTYCYDHLPSHMKKKLSESVRTNFEASRSK
jgi:hypothetical protein